MSNSYNYITIIGYNLTNFTTDKFNAWQYSSEWERLAFDKFPNKVRLFDQFLELNLRGQVFLGFVVSNQDKHYMETQCISLREANVVRNLVLNVLMELIGKGIICNSAKEQELKIISFVEET